MDVYVDLRLVNRGGSDGGGTRFCANGAWTQECQ